MGDFYLQNNAGSSSSMFPPMAWAAPVLFGETYLSHTVWPVENGYLDLHYNREDIPDQFSDERNYNDEVIQMPDYPDSNQEAIKAGRKGKRNHRRRQVIKAKRGAKAKAPKGQNSAPSPNSDNNDTQYSIAEASSSAVEVAMGTQAVQVLQQQTAIDIANMQPSINEIEEPPTLQQIDSPPATVEITGIATMPPLIQSRRPYSSVNRTLDSRPHLHTYRPYSGSSRLPRPPARSPISANLGKADSQYDDAVAAVKACETRFKFALYASKTYLAKHDKANTPEEREAIMESLREKNLLMKTASEALKAAITVRDSIPRWSKYTYCVEHIMISDDEEEAEEEEEAGAEETDQVCTSEK